MGVFHHLFPHAFYFSKVIISKPIPNKIRHYLLTLKMRAVVHDGNIQNSNDDKFKRSKN